MSSNNKVSTGSLCQILYVCVSVFPVFFFQRLPHSGLDNLKIKTSSKNNVEIKNEDDLKNEEDLKDEDNLKNKDDL